MTQIGPEGAADLSLIRAVRPPALAPLSEVAPRPAGTQPEVRAPRSQGSSAGAGQLPRQDAIATLTRTDGFADDDPPVLSALRQLLRDSLAGAGSLDDLAERLIDRLSALLPPELHDATHPGHTDQQHGSPAARPFLPAPAGAPATPAARPSTPPGPGTKPGGALPPPSGEIPQPSSGGAPQSSSGGAPQSSSGGVPQSSPGRSGQSPAAGGVPQPADGFPAVMPPQRQADLPPSAGFPSGGGRWALPVPANKTDIRLTTVITPPVHPPNLPSTPTSAGGRSNHAGPAAGQWPHQSLLVPAGPPIIALAAQTAPPTMRDLRMVLAGDPRVRREQVGQALSWLLENLDRPQVVAATCADLGPALQHLGASPLRLDALGVLVSDALRATVGGTWRQEHYDAWHSSARLVTSWMSQGMERVDYEPAFWTATVVGHDRRGDDRALLSVRTYLPYRFGAGQFATVESARHPQLWHPYWIASVPSEDNTVAIEVRATPDDLVAEALVNATACGDRVRLRPARGGLALDRNSDRDLLLIAHDTGIAPIRALLADLRHHREVRGVHLLWVVDRAADQEPIRELAGRDVTLLHAGELAAAVTDGDWAGCDVYVSGSPEEVRATVTILTDARVPTDRIRQTALVGPEFEPIPFEPR